MKKRNYLLHVNFSAEEAEKLKTNATACGLTQSEFMRMLIAGKAPKQNPDPRFWIVIRQLCGIHDSLKSIADVGNPPEAAEDARRMQRQVAEFVLDLQARFTLPDKLKGVDEYGDNENMGD